MSRLWVSTKNNRKQKLIFVICFRRLISFCLRHGRSSVLRAALPSISTDSPSLKHKTICRLNGQTFSAVWRQSSNRIPWFRNRRFTTDHSASMASLCPARLRLRTAPSPRVQKNSVGFRTKLTLVGRLQQCDRPAEVESPLRNTVRRPVANELLIEVVNS